MQQMLQQQHNVLIMLKQDDGDTNLATAKQQAKDALRQMTHLSDAQKQSITGQIDSATQVTGVQSAKTTRQILIMQ